MGGRRIGYFVTVAIVLCGCASVAPDQSDEVEEPVAELPQERLPGSPVAVDSDQVTPENEAVTYLLDSAERALRVEDFGRAQALADRALRIERTAARAYLISAKVQLSIGDLDRASDLARQGLLYVPGDSELGQQLLEVMTD